MLCDCVQDMGVDDPSHRSLMIAAVRAEGPSAWHARAGRVSQASAAVLGKDPPKELAAVYLRRPGQSIELDYIVPGDDGGLAAGRASGVLTWKTGQDGGAGGGWTRGFAVSLGDGWVRLYRRCKVKSGSPWDKEVKLRGAIIMESTKALNAITVQVCEQRIAASFDGIEVYDCRISVGPLEDKLRRCPSRVLQSYTAPRLAALSSLIRDYKGIPGY